LSTWPDQRLLEEARPSPVQEVLRMSRRFAIAFLTVAPLTFLAPKLAHAGLEACGNINVKADAKCEVQVEGGCTAKCTPVSFQAACEGQAVVKCDGECKGSIEASCTTSCKADCTASCTADPGSYDCTGKCEGSCGADCDAQCAGQASGGTASGSCKASCQANCNAKCSASCTGTPPSATCDAKCSASCSGKCQAKATGSCQVACQANFDDVKCKADLKGGCDVQCKDPDGAIFCDGQYVDSGGNLAKCADALNAILNLKFEASGSAECSNGQCTAEGSASASACSTTSEGQGHTPPVAPGVIVLGAIGAAIARRFRRSGS
jgi:hypothetical protein